MARQTAINTADDMRWLREVHLPRLPAKYKSAIIVGNEDFPDRIEVYERRDPRVTDVPIVFKAAEDGVFKETAKGTAGAKRSHAAKKAGLSADQRAEIDAALGAYGARLTDDDRIAKGDKVMSVQVEAKGGRLKMVGGGNVLATYPASRAGQGVSDFVEKFWFWRKDGAASAHATKKSPAQLQREIDAFLAGLPDEVARGVSRTSANDLLEYAQERANATGRAYAISNMGHVMVADAHNKRAMRDELGGVALVVKPSRGERQRSGRPDTAASRSHATKKKEATYSVSYWVPHERYWQFAGEGSQAWAKDREKFLRDTDHKKVRVRKV